VWGQALKPTFENFSPSPLKNLAAKTSILPTTSDTEAHNFETAQHINKQITEV